MSVTKPADFDCFWEKNIASSKAKPLNPIIEQTDYPIAGITVYDLKYDGCDDTVVHGWFLIPSFIKKDKYPCIICYHGFGGSRGKPSDFLRWLMLGMCVIAVDCRGHKGTTVDAHTYKNVMISNSTSLGILDKNDYYYKFVYLDCLRAVDFAHQRPEIDTGKIILEGGSQGGALVLAVGALDGRQAAMFPDVPSNCELELRIKGGHGAFNAVRDYIKLNPHTEEQCYQTLRYFDVVNMADRITCPVYSSVGAEDPVCPPKFFLSAVSKMKTKDVTVINYPFCGHEGGGSTHREKQLLRMKQLLDELERQ